MRILFRNWHLKLAAIMLATVLYTGLVYSGELAEDTIEVRVEQINAPPNSYVLSEPPQFVQVRYQSPNDTVGSVVAEAFVARLDLAEYDLNRAGEPQVIDLQVSTLTENIEILDADPPSARVSIDRLEVRTVPVEVDSGTVPAGLELGDPVLSVEEVEVRGPASVVGLVDRALAPITIQSSGIDFNEPVNLVPVDIEGQPVGEDSIDVEPETVSVQMDVRPTETTQTFTVRPDISGTPAPGFALEALIIDPVIVTLRGLPEVLSGIGEILTEPISIDGASADQAFEADLVLPAGTRLADEAETSFVGVTATIVPSVSSRTFVVGVVCAGAADNACLPAIDQLTVTLSGPSGVLSGLGAGDVTPIVDVAGLGPGTYDLTPVIGALPDGVAVLAITPGSVSVTLRAPATPSPSPTPAP